MHEIEKLYSFWFDNLSGTPEYIKSREQIWFYKNPEIDQFIIEKFSPWIDTVTDAEVKTWMETQQGYVSLILLFDQVPRNSFRGSPKSFGTDQKALDFCLRGIELKKDEGLSVFEKLFFYLPLEHSEEISIQKKSMEQFQKLYDEFSHTEYKKYAEELLHYAKLHHDIVERFGRFPHRNVVLNRTSSAEEIAFLKEPGSSF